MSDKQKKLILAIALFVIAGGIIAWQLSRDTRPGEVVEGVPPATDAPEGEQPEGPRGPSTGGRALGEPQGG